MFPPNIQRRRARRLVVCLAAGLGVLSVAATSVNVWTFEVRKIVEQGPFTHVIYLIPAPSGINFPRTCSELVIHAQLERGKGVPFAYKEEFNPEGYDRAIREIQRAQVSNELVRLVSLATGFGRPEDSVDDCLVFSSGLAFMLDRDQRPSIFSVF